MYFIEFHSCCSAICAFNAFFPIYILHSNALYLKRNGLPFFPPFFFSVAFLLPSNSIDLCLHLWIYVYCFGFCGNSCTVHAFVVQCKYANVCQELAEVTSLEWILWVCFVASIKSTTVSLWHSIARNRRTNNHLTCKQRQKEAEQNTGTKTINAPNYSNCIVLFVFVLRHFHLNKMIWRPFWFRWSKKPPLGVF